MMLSDQGDKCLCKTDESDSEGSVIDYRFDCVVVRKLFAVQPQGTHKERELLFEGSLLEIESFVELSCGDLKRPVELLEEFVDPVFLALDTHTFYGELHDIDGSERKVSTTDGRLRSETVLEHAGAAAHCSHLPLVSLRIVCLPELVMVERCVQVHEVREETSCGYLAGKLVKIVVAVFRKVAHSAFLLPDLDREDGCRAVSHAFICGVEDFADHAASFGRSVSSVIDRTEYHLVTSA